MEKLGLIDLPYLMKARNNVLTDVTMVGVLLGEVEKPSHFDGIELLNNQDKFAVVELVGVETPTSRYYCKGKVLTVVNKKLLDIAKSKDSGKLAVALKGGTARLNDRKDVSNFIHFMRWHKAGVGGWRVASVTANGFRGNDYPEFFRVVVEAHRNNWVFNFPVEESSDYNQACEGYDFVLVGGQAIPTSTQPVRSPQPSHPTQSNVLKPEGWGFNGSPSVAQATKVPETVPSANPAIFANTQDNVGLSNSSETDTLARNRSLTHQYVKDTSRFKVQNRDSFLPETDNFKKMVKAQKEADMLLEKSLETLDKYKASKEDEDGDTSIYTPLLEYTATKLKEYWDRKAGVTTGRMLFKQAVEDVLKDIYEKESGASESTIDSSFEIRGSRLVDTWLKVSEADFENDFFRSLHVNRFEIYLAMVDSLLGLRGKLPNAFFQTEKDGISLIELLKTNPYELCYIDATIPVEYLDKLAMFYNVDRTQEDVERVRNIAYLHNFMLDSTNAIVGDSTLVKKDLLATKLMVGYILSKRDYATLQAEGVIVPQGVISSLKTFFESSIEVEQFALPKNGWTPKGFKVFLQNKNKNTEHLVSDYLASGLGVDVEIEGVKYIADYVFFSKEVYIYERLKELSESAYVPKVSEEEYDKVISNFEKLKAKEYNMKEGDFKLENRQAQAVKMLKHPIMCLTGPAGSGKTTTAEALVYGIETLLKVKEDEIMFCAPTGRAANRLKESVKRKTSTINSLFGIGGNSMSLKPPTDIRVREDIKVLIVDESSMPNINLMYELLLRITDGTFIYFLGDVEQLPPIGFGKPFASMLTYLPTVVLDVTKRASDSSGITRNAKEIIYNSDGVLQDLREYNDFKIIQSKLPDEVADRAEDICRHLVLGEEPTTFVPTDLQGKKISPDDIQFISPTNKHAWGTKMLNKRLQNIFNPRNPNQKYVTHKRTATESVEFRVGDRVMHSDSNQNDRTRLRMVDIGSYVYEDTTGITNGDVGKIVGFHYAKELDFSRELNAELSTQLTQEFKGDDNTVYMAVKFEGVDEETSEPIEFIILYRMRKLNEYYNEIEAMSKDLMHVNHAYVSTVHKLQGSEAKIIIYLILPLGRDFISRNMIYTGITRAKLGLYLVGDVYGKSSAVNRGRKVKSTDKRNVSLDLM